MRVKLIGTVAVLVSLILFAGSQSKAAELIKANQLQKLFSGGTLYTDQYGHYFDNHQEQWQIKAGGALTASYEIAAETMDLDPTYGSDVGTWKVMGDNFCITWTKLMKGRENCYLIHTAAGHKFADKMYKATNVATGNQWSFGLEH